MFHFAFSSLFCVFLWNTLQVSAQDVYADGVDCLNIPRYTGGWWEIYTSRSVWTDLEYGCRCSNVYYNLYNLTDPTDTRISVLNMCQRYENGWWNVTGVATQLYPSTFPGQFNVKLNVDTGESEESVNYIILRIWRSMQGDYEHALIGGQTSKFWWFISRYPTVQSSVWRSARKTLEAYDYDVINAHKTDQGVC